MKDLQSKEHYSYKIHTLLMRGSAYPHSIDTSHLYIKILITPTIFQKSQPHVKKDLHTTEVNIFTYALQAILCPRFWSPTPGRSKLLIFSRKQFFESLFSSRKEKGKNYMAGSIKFIFFNLRPKVATAVKINLMREIPWTGII